MELLNITIATIEKSNITISLEDIYYFIGILSAIFVAGGTIIAVIQYLHQKKLNKVKEASIIAKYFEEDVIHYISMVLVVFSMSEDIKEMILSKRDKIENARFFNKDELLQIFEKEEVEKYNNFINTYIFEKNESSLKNIITRTMNKMEHFAISFNSKIAEEKVVYQSLHQVLFKLMPYVYIYIADLNSTNVDKYFTNSYILYQRWIKIRGKAQKKEEKAERKYRKHESERAKSGIVMPPKA